MNYTDRLWISILIQGAVVEILYNGAPLSTWLGHLAVALIAGVVSAYFWHRSA